MRKKILFIGPDFTELVFEKNSLRRELIDRLWEQCTHVDSVVTFNAFVEELQQIRKEESYYRKNEQFDTLVTHISDDFNYISIRDNNERLSMFKKVVAQTLLAQSQTIDLSMQTLLSDYLAGYDYIFSYQCDALVERLLHRKKAVTVCTDRQALLLSEARPDASVLYKLYGSLDQADTLLVTPEEKAESIINLRMAVSKLTAMKPLDINLIGFNEDKGELDDILKELSEKEVVEHVTFYRAGNQPLEKYHYVNKTNTLRLELTVSDLKTYLIANIPLDKQALKPLKKAPLVKSKDKTVKSTSKWQFFRKKKKREKNIEKKQKPYKTLVFVSLTLVGVLSFNFFFSLATISGESMAPSFSASDYILLNKQYSKVKRFDVIAFDSPDEREREYIKRVIGVPGDEIEYIDDQLYINRNLIKETYLDREKKKLGKGETFTKDFSLESLAGVKVVPQNKLFVLGDNRLYSRDSRDFGFVDIQDIKGDVTFKLWPIKF